MKALWLVLGAAALAFLWWFSGREVPSIEMSFYRDTPCDEDEDWTYYTANMN